MTPPTAGIAAGGNVFALAVGDDGMLDPQAVIMALYAHGLRTLLIKGGDWTVWHFISAGMVDRLHVPVAQVPLDRAIPAIVAPVLLPRRCAAASFSRLPADRE